MSAKISANSVIVAGRVKGRIWAKEKVVLQRGSRLEGDVHATVFKIEDGAFFQGNCAMGDEQKPHTHTPSSEARKQGGSVKVVSG